MLCYATPYTPETLPAKIGAFILFTSIMGVTMAPLISIAGPLVGRAALYTAGVVGGLTAACAPSDKYLKWGGPLALGLGVVFVSSIGGMFAAPGGAVFSALHTVYMYGGLVLFGGFLLYDTQKIVYHAEHDHHYDPINMSMGIYLDTVNIFIRILSLLAGSGNKRR
jgi:FtsH-binding integral membrane protein